MPDIDMNLLEDISYYENRRIEFKNVEALEDKHEIARQLSSFANQEGGKLIFGVTDEGDIQGEEINEDIEMGRISRADCFSSRFGVIGQRRSSTPIRPTSAHGFDRGTRCCHLAPTLTRRRRGCHRCRNSGRRPRPLGGDVQAGDGSGDEFLEHGACPSGL
jgi:hypothetical protein